MAQIAALGLGVVGNAIYDILKTAISSNRDISSTGDAIQNELNSSGINAKASNIIQILANSGHINISQSKLYAPNEITFGSSTGGEANIGDSSVMRTDKTEIDISKGGNIHAKGNVQIHQDEDGNIIFST